MDNNKLHLVLCWHLHQPDYRNLHTGAFELPWTYLHVIKDYVDMAAHLEALPAVKAVVNFTPVLLAQIECYALQLKNHLAEQTPITDPLLAALSTDLPHDPKLRRQLLQSCLYANRQRQIDRYPAFAKLADQAGALLKNSDDGSSLDTQAITDLVVWYHLAWLGETVKLTDKRVQALLQKSTGYAPADRRQLLEVIAEQLNQVVVRYKHLALNGQIELSVTPYAHPIMPLLLDLQAARQALPDAVLPALAHYPGGAARVRWHLQTALESFERCFGFKPKGCWPSEGAVCEQTLEILAELGFIWTATGSAVLANSLAASGNPAQPAYYPFTVKDIPIACFFRDDALSDLIGFEYSNLPADKAVEDFIKHLEHIAATEPPESVVAMIMDGENAWEYFPQNGYPFLRKLYAALAAHPGINLTTFSEYLEQGGKPKYLPHLVAGSWVKGSLSTWIGSTGKNQSWEMLGEAKKTFDRVIATGRLNAEQIRQAHIQLALCESSDWSWWLDDAHPNESVANFQRLFRLNLANLYRLLGEVPPTDPAP